MVATNTTLDGRVVTARTTYLTLRERRHILVIGDLVATSLAALLSLVVWSEVAPTGSFDWLQGKLGWIPVLVGAWMASALLLGSYLQPYLHRTARSWAILIGTGGLVIAAYSLMYFFAPRSMLPRLVVLVFVAFGVGVVGAWRRLWDWAGGRESLRRPVIIVGASPLGEILADILAPRNSGYRVIGFVDDDATKQGQLSTPDGHIRDVFGASPAMLDLVDRFGPAEIVLAFRGQAKPSLIKAVLACHERGLIVSNASDLYEAATGRLPIWHVGDNWGAVLPLAHPGGRAMYLAVKRTVDVVGVVLGLALFALALPVAAVAIKLDSRGPVFYRQRRTGRGGRSFSIWKLRTMRADAEFANGPVWATLQDPRTTRVGRWLRRSHIDEVPQLWNVLKGEMSLVGPRPERPEIDEQLERVIPFYRLRFAVKPGIAGWGAVNGSYVDAEMKAVERLEYDLYYIKHQSLWLDLQIIASAAHRALLLRGR